MQQVFSLLCFVQTFFVCCFAAYFTNQPAGTTYALINSTVKIDCAISGSTFIPLWKINGTIYDIYTDPPNGSLNGSPLKTLAGSSDINNITIDSILYSTEMLMMSSSINTPMVIESIKSSSFGNETTVGNSHNVRVIFISAVVSSICASLLMIAAMCLIVFALVRKKRKEKKSTKTFSESNPVYDEPVHENIQFNPSYGLVRGPVRSTVNPVYEEINLT
uniref:Ig-like domain-containing protein n=1 Tax=Amphimedon queenslandica TaxID=400682 RepID=A0A1X7VQ76_AMPQE